VKGRDPRERVGSRSQVETQEGTVIREIKPTRRERRYVVVYEYEKEIRCLSVKEKDGMLTQITHGRDDEWFSSRFWENYPHKLFEIAR